MAEVRRQRPDQRRPQFAVGARSSWQVRDTVAGFNIYGDVVGGFSDDDEQLSQAFAAQASIVVSNAQAYWTAFDLSRNLTKAMETRAVIEQAKGVLMSTHRIDADAAFDVLRERSQASNRKLRDVAADVVDEATGGDDDASRPSEAARQHLGLSYLDVWIDYFALGGNLDADQLADYLRGERDVSDADHNVVAHALNELFRRPRRQPPTRLPTSLTVRHRPVASLPL